MSTVDDPKDVIPLSRWRARLARSTRQGRIRQWLDQPNPQELIHSIPPVELYHAIQEVGLDGASDVLALISAEQAQALVDLDGWSRERLAVGRSVSWLLAIAEAGDLDHFALLADSLDSELWSLLIRRSADVIDLAEEDPDELRGVNLPDPTLPTTADPQSGGAAATVEDRPRRWSTPDGCFALELRPGLARSGEEVDDTVDEQTVEQLERLLDLLYRADQRMAQRVVMGARYDLTSDLEETCLRFRTGRLADLGFPSYDDALAIYRYLDPRTVAATLGAGGGAGAPRSAGGGPAAMGLPDLLPVRYAEALSRDSFFAQAMGHLPESQLAQLQEPLLALLNRVLVAERVESSEGEALRPPLELAEGFLSLGLEYLTKGDLDQSGRVVAEVPLVRIFQVGVSLTLQLQRLATTLVRSGRLGPRGDELWLEAPYDELFRGLRKVRPELATGLDPVATDGPRPGIETDPRTRTTPYRPLRPFRRLQDVRLAAQAIEDVAELVALVQDALGLKAAVPLELRLRTAMAHGLSGRAVSTHRPLTMEELEALLPGGARHDQLFQGPTLSEGAEEALLAALAAQVEGAVRRSAAPAPGQQDSAPPAGDPRPAGGLGSVERSVRRQLALLTEELVRLRPPVRPEWVGAVMVRDSAAAHREAPPSAARP